MASEIFKKGYSAMMVTASFLLGFVLGFYSVPAYAVGTLAIGLIIVNGVLHLFGVPHRPPTSS